MANRTERDLSPDPREGGRRRFMIAGEHVILRAFEREDAERCYRWLNDPNIVRTLIDGTLDLIVRLIRLSSLPLMGPLRRRLLHTLRAATI